MHKTRCLSFINNSYGGTERHFYSHISSQMAVERPSITRLYIAPTLVRPVTTETTEVVFTLSLILQHQQGSPTPPEQWHYT